MLTAMNAIGAWALYSLFRAGVLNEGWLIITAALVIGAATYATARLTIPPTVQDHMMTRKTLTAQELQAALLDPSMVFSEPQDVIALTGIPDDRKIEILRRWEYDVREQEVAQEENMPGELPVTLAQVHAALNAIGARPLHDRGPPTKQGGL
ncbi:hypothetical protein OLX02_13285 [Novosphingobium sp. KCTC 2891]|uniref:hypothetical protein n=1 Tax=Novosphingobium sp. KCTC 2891 TaxID=2989730 RepID=UPI0022222FCB|nr:hypothetical protein [Novosphingobium sp. KCTC 2891]MCW1383796.1 hypothetical protein [Novosphingobium sp. KCTC 2891]